MATARDQLTGANMEFDEWWAAATAAERERCAGRYRIQMR